MASGNAASSDRVASAKAGSRASREWNTGRAHSEGRGRGEDSDHAFPWQPSACSVDLARVAGLNADLQKRSKVPFSGTLLLKEFLRDKGEGFQLQTYTHVGVRDINREEHLWVTEVPSGTVALGGLCLHSFFFLVQSSS